MLPSGIDTIRARCGLWLGSTQVEAAGKGLLRNMRVHETRDSLGDSRGLRYPGSGKALNGATTVIGGAVGGIVESPGPGKGIPTPGRGAPGKGAGNGAAITEGRGDSVVVGVVERDCGG